MLGSVGQTTAHSAKPQIERSSKNAARARIGRTTGLTRLTRVEVWSTKLAPIMTKGELLESQFAGKNDIDELFGLSPRDEGARARARKFDNATQSLFEPSLLETIGDETFEGARNAPVRRWHGQYGVKMSPSPIVVRTIPSFVTVAKVKID